MGDKTSERLKTGIFWNFIGKFSGKFLSFATNIVLARILMPEDFGKVAVAMVVWEVITVFGEMGLSAKLIHQQDELHEHATAAFWMNILIALVIGLAALAISPLAVRFYHQPMIKSIIAVLALGNMITAFGATHSTLLTKKMAFKQLSLLIISLAIIRSAISIILVTNGFGIWSLVLPQLLTAPLRVAAVWIMEPWRPEMRLYSAYWKSLFHFGKFVFGTTMIHYININGDYMVIGKILGASALGLYQHAYTIANWPISNLVWVSGRLLFPAFSRLQNNLAEFRSLYLRAIETMSILAFPVLTGLILVAGDLIPLVYGEKWRPSVVPLKLILLFAFVRTVGSIGGKVLMAVGKPQKEFRFNAAQAIPLIIAILVGSKFGITGVAAGMSLVLASFGVVFVRVASSAIGLTMGSVGRAIWPASSCSFLMWLVLTVLGLILTKTAIHETTGLFLTIGCGMLLYPTFLFLLFRKQSMKLLRLVIDILSLHFSFLALRRKTQFSR